MVQILGEEKKKGGAQNLSPMCLVVFQFSTMLQRFLQVKEANNDNIFPTMN